MSSRHKRPMFILSLVMASCGGASHWELACGCISASASAGQELGITSYMSDGSIDPPVLVEKLHTQLEKRTLVTSTLAAVREIGPFHDHACYQHIMGRVRCTYWLWENESSRRGIQVTLEGDYFSPPKSEWITYDMVEEKLR